MNNTTNGFFARLATALVLITGAGCVSADDGKPGQNGQPENAVSPVRQQLALEAEKAIELAGSSPGREFANRLRTPPNPAWIDYFQGSGPKPAQAGEDWAAKAMKRITNRIHAGLKWPKPGTHAIPFVSSPPEIDGVLDDEAWQQAATWTSVYPFNQTEESGPKTTWHIAWDNTYLYVAFDCADTDVIAAERERDGHVYFDDCVEVFLLPAFEFRTYWEIVVGPNGSVFDALHCKKVREWGSNGDTSRDLTGMKHAQTVRGTLNDSTDEDEGYSVEIAIPFSQLPEYTRCKPDVGHRLHFMLARLDRSREEFKTYAFRPLMAWGHNIWNYAVMELTAENAGN